MVYNGFRNKWPFFILSLVKDLSILAFVNDIYQLNNRRPYNPQFSIKSSLWRLEDQKEIAYRFHGVRYKNRNVSFIKASDVNLIQ